MSELIFNVIVDDKKITISLENEENDFIFEEVRIFRQYSF